jgi:hypothetical protein
MTCIYYTYREYREYREYDTDRREFERVFMRCDGTSQQMLPLSYDFLKSQCGGKRRKMVPEQVL